MLYLLIFCQLHLSFFDPTTNTMRIMPGKYEIMYGNSSDIPYGNKLSVTLRNNITH